MRVVAELMPSQQQSIVIVEDDAAMRKAIERLLRGAGFQSMSFASAEALLQTDAVDDAACLVLDIYLPGLSGLELQQLLVSTGRTNRSFSSPGKMMRPCATKRAYLRKPFAGKELLEAIRLANLGGTQ
jgi:FixJ family two-component response regulator